MKKKYFNQRVIITISSKEKAIFASHSALDKKADDVVIFEVKEVTSIADYFVICTADSQPQMIAVTDEVETRLREKGVYPLGIEGEKISQWILLDYGDVIVHIFRKEARAFYNLDGLWGDSPKVVLEEKAVKVKAAR